MPRLKKTNIERKPSHPGEILKNIWLDELGITQARFAELLSDMTKGKIRVSTMQTKLNEIINGKRGISADFAVLLSKVLNTSPYMWMDLQNKLDIWEAEQNAA